jgi:meiotically up-regulated gene 157 (Mug157) protein
MSGRRSEVTCEASWDFRIWSSPDSALYEQTRRFVPEEKTRFYKSSVDEGIGGAHIEHDMIWPMSQFILLSDTEIVRMIRMLQRSSASSCYMHESHHKDDPVRFTQAWFAWANTLFGELVGKIVQTKLQLLQRDPERIFAHDEES